MCDGFIVFICVAVNTRTWQWWGLLEPYLAGCHSNSRNQSLPSVWPVHIIVVSLHSHDLHLQAPGAIWGRGTKYKSSGGGFSEEGVDSTWLWFAEKQSISVTEIGLRGRSSIKVGFSLEYKQMLLFMLHPWQNKSTELVACGKKSTSLHLHMCRARHV